MQYGNDVDVILPYAIDRNVGKSGNDERSRSSYDSRSPRIRPHRKPGNRMLDTSHDALCCLQIELNNVVVNSFDIVQRARLVSNPHLVKRSNVARTSVSLANGSSSKSRRSISA